METIIETTITHPDQLSTLVQRAAVDQHAFAQLYRAYLPRVYAYVYSRVANQEAAEDISGQVFLTLLQKLPALRDPQRFTPWLFSIARHKCMDHFRALKRDRDRHQTLTWLFDAQPAEHQDLSDLERAFQNLPALEQDILRLRFMADMSLKEVAQVLKRSEGAIKSRYYRCLEKLQHCLRLEEDHD